MLYSGSEEYTAFDRRPSSLQRKRSAPSFAATREGKAADVPFSGDGHFSSAKSSVRPPETVETRESDTAISMNYPMATANSEPYQYVGDPYPGCFPLATSSTGSFFDLDFYSPGASHSDTSHTLMNQGAVPLTAINSSPSHIQAPKDMGLYHNSSKLDSVPSGRVVNDSHDSSPRMPANSFTPNGFDSAGNYLHGPPSVSNRSLKDWDFPQAGYPDVNTNLNINFQGGKEHMEEEDKGGHEDENGDDDPENSDLERNSSFPLHRGFSSRTPSSSALAAQIPHSSYSNFNTNMGNVGSINNNNNNRKVSDSRLSAQGLAEVLNLNSAGEALRRERFILDIFERELHYPLGYKTWVRDTSKEYRTRLLDQLHRRVIQTYPEYDKPVLETIIRRATYYMMQSRLRRERRARAKMSRDQGRGIMESADANDIGNADVRFTSHPSSLSFSFTM
ncbi:LADA_0D02410g1_1 [Lachancea dasiensis]|uniref:LADA_0D02410g1_1 n=1 Tax=Lachancea dasiensis TaxID=1072105 RepID=A0A1G4J477_9SACH|nr:LADA_0D02410g1_1 [Lachancea dasiensis]